MTTSSQTLQVNYPWVVFVNKEAIGEYIDHYGPLRAWSYIFFLALSCFVSPRLCRFSLLSCLLQSSSWFWLHRFWLLFTTSSNLSTNHTVLGFIKETQTLYTQDGDFKSIRKLKALHRRVIERQPSSFSTPAPFTAELTTVDETLCERCEILLSDQPHVTRRSCDCTWCAECVKECFEIVKFDLINLWALWAGAASPHRSLPSGRCPYVKHLLSEKSSLANWEGDSGARHDARHAARLRTNGCLTLMNRRISRDIIASITILALSTNPIKVAIFH